ncbi:MAG: TauD/TfdA family dioxygenase [Anaerolineae bacterium]|nr:TauD/TfdA family dioxygenase [Anaerolineae bacterium]
MQKKTGLKKLGPFNKKAVQITQDDVVEFVPQKSTGQLPQVIRPAVDGVDLIAWAGSNLKRIEEQLLTHGGLLFQGFHINDVDTFQQFTKATTNQDLLEYVYRSTPRTQVSGNVYTSTEYPADQSIPMHNEGVYTRSWPMKIWFLCLQPAEVGGETPIADCRRVFQRIPTSIKEKFQKTGVKYVRNYSAALDLPWQEVFQTTDKSKVEDFCRQSDITFEWREDNLRTSQVCQAVAEHPRTGDLLWCNQAHLFHVAGLAPQVREALLAIVDEDHLPRNAYYGDGQPIEPAVIEEINGIYQQESVASPWQAGDILMLDNMLVAHGRRPYRGARKIVVGMAEPYSSS